MDTISRSRFFKTAKVVLASTGITALIGPILAYFYPAQLEETPTAPVFVSNEGEIPMNESRTVLYGRYPAIVVRTTEGLKAYSAVCTHFACIVKWNKEINQFACPCHAGFYDSLDGHVISGPPPRPLASIPVMTNGGQIYIGDKL